MKIDICNDAILGIEGQASAILDYLAEEYATSLLPEMDDRPVELRIELEDDRSDPRQSKIYGPTVCRDRFGVYFNDGNHRCFRLDFASLSGECWHATCDWDFDARAFDRILTQLVQLRLLCRGKCLLPAAAFEYHGRKVLVPAGHGAGKTNLLLSFITEGARLIADDHVSLSRSGEVQGLGKRLRIGYRNLEAFPDLACKLDEPTAALVNLLGFARCGEVELDKPLIQHLENGLRSQVSSAELLGQDPEPQPQPLDTLLLLDHRPWDEGIVKAEPADVKSLVGSLTALWEQEMQDLLSAYRVYREQTGRQAELLDSWRPVCESVLYDALRHCQQARKILVPAQHAASTPYQVVAALLDEQAAADTQFLQKAG